MKIYRVERDGKGPYKQNWELCEELHVSHGNWNVMTHPNPRIEGLCLAMDNRVCGFSTIEQLKQWFYGWRTKLREYGFKMKVYEISHKYTCIGEKQLIFHRELATEVACLNIP